MTVRRLFTGLFVLSLFAMAVRETLDPDMWWHLRTGQVIVTSGIPRQDIYSFTVSDHEWIAHEWLSEVFMWGVYRLAGLPGLMIFFAAIIALTFWLVYRRCDGRPYLAAFVVLLAAVASAIVWGARPQMFNMLFLALFIYLVEGFKDGLVSRRALWLLPLLTIAWVNLHSGYLLGIVLLAVYVIGESGQLLLGRRDQRGLSGSDTVWLAAVAGLSFLAAAVNPNGVQLWIYPFFTLGSSAMQQYIQEWGSPDFHLRFFWPFGALLATGILAWLAYRRRPAWTDLLLFGGTAAAGLLSARNIPFFALVAAPIVARYLWRALEGTAIHPLLRDSSPGQIAPRLVRLNWLIFLSAILLVAVWSAAKVASNPAAVDRRFPVAAVDYLEASGLGEQRGYNSYNWGGYLIWRGLPVFVDGRADVYGDEFLFYYRRTFDLTANWSLPLDEFDVTYVLIEQDSPLAILLVASGGWREVYSDRLAAVFTRASATQVR